MTDWGASGRRDEYRYLVVDPFSLAVTGEVEAVSARVTFGYNTDNKRQADVELADRWPGGLLRIDHTVTVDGESTTETLGTFFVESSGYDVYGKLTRHNVSCYSTLWRHTQDYLANDLVRAAGVDIVSIIRDIVQYDGGTLVVMPDVVSRNLSTQHVFELKDGKAKSTYMNTCAGWIGAQIDVADTGEIVLQKYYSPRDKGIAYTFEEGTDCTYVGGYQLSDTTADSINRVVAYYSTQDSTLRAMVDLEAADPDSYQNTGRRKTHLLAITEQVTQSQLLQAARDYLEANKGSSYRIEFEHAGIPGLRAGQVIRYVNHVDGDIDVTAIIEQMELTCGPGCMTRTKARLL